MAHVLIIEPDVRLARTYAGRLQADGHEVAACTTGQGGVCLADRRMPDVVLLELQLVSHGGVEFLYEFRSYEDWRPVPVIVVSHVPPAEFKTSERLLRDRLGVRGYLYKPQMSLQSLAEAVERALAVYDIPAGAGLDNRI